MILGHLLFDEVGKSQTAVLTFLRKQRLEKI